MKLVSDQDWADFKNLFKNDVPDTFAQADIIWRRSKTPNLDRWKEDNPSVVTEDITLKCLVNYNYLRSWPITNFTEAGELNGQSIQVLFSKQYLFNNGYLNNAGAFDYNADFDRFILDGTIRKPAGDSSVSQAYDESIWYEVIMVEQRTATGDKRD